MLSNVVEGKGWHPSSSLINRVGYGLLRSSHSALIRHLQWTVLEKTLLMTRFWNHHYYGGRIEIFFWHSFKITEESMLVLIASYWNIDAGLPARKGESGGNEACSCQDRPGAKPIHTVVGMLQLLKVNTCNTGMKLQVTEVYGTARAQKGLTAAS